MKIHKTIKKKIPKELMQVTPLSKSVAAIVFITLPFVGFLFGIEYGKFIASSDRFPMEQSSRPSTQPSGIMCTMDAKICPDGSAVGRVGPTCEFAQCPLPGMKKTIDSMSTGTSTMPRSY